jgi:PIN domain nuclease of toxin-antitoxin system
MIILLDSCDFLWFVSGSEMLPTRLKEEIENPSNTIYLSVVSLWEIIIKEALGKMPLPKGAAEYVPEQRDRHRILSLELNEASVKLLSNLPMVHRDPFDRMLVCQAQAHAMKLCSSDPVMKQYPVNLL